MHNKLQKVNQKLQTLINNGLSINSKYVYAIRTFLIIRLTFYRNNVQQGLSNVQPQCSE